MFCISPGSELRSRFIHQLTLPPFFSPPQEFSSSWDIRATPTFFFLKNEQQVDKLVGANKPELEKKVAAVADAAGSKAV
jgi:hypothetical protein